MKCFENLIVVFGSIICNIIYNIVESFSLIYKREHDSSNHVKTLCIIVSIVLFLCS